MEVKNVIIALLVYSAVIKHCDASSKNPEDILRDKNVEYEAVGYYM